MPLQPGSSKAAISYNIGVEMNEGGKKRKQAIAIALHKAGKYKKKAVSTPSAGVSSNG